MGMEIISNLQDSGLDSWADGGMTFSEEER